ncbi:class I SAM-dependent methyltransferase, partial [uncultured Marinobacter sp.]|uniref:class I SAM-dependent methyltransferase n=1 Tax=uncultured Marinobacter sp. TaxID=187379 RepID=UPI00258684CE
ASYRRQHGGGKSEAIAKACGLQKKRDVTVLDATAGLGRDAFVLASLGASVTLVERNPAVAALLYDGLRRGAQTAELSWLPERMQLLHCSALQALTTHAAVDVVYLDPMFPPRDKTALVKKEMQVFRQVVGDDDDSAQLLQAALKAARYRVVVKRPRKAPFVEGPEPATRIEGKSSRYDIYSLKALPA